MCSQPFKMSLTYTLYLHHRREKVGSRSWTKVNFSEMHILPLHIFPTTTTRSWKSDTCQFSVVLLSIILLLRPCDLDFLLGVYIQRLVGFYIQRLAKFRDFVSKLPESNEQKYSPLPEQPTLDECLLKIRRKRMKNEAIGYSMCIYFSADKKNIYILRMPSGDYGYPISRMRNSFGWNSLSHP